MRSHLYLFLCAIGLCIPGSTTADESKSDSKSTAKTYNLKYKFTGNQFAHYQVHHTSTIVTRYAQGSETTFNESNTRKHFRVTSIKPDGAAVLEPVIDHVKMRVRFGDQEPIDFDSDWKAARIPKKFQTIKQTIGRPLARIHVTSTGRLESAAKIEQSKIQQTTANSSSKTRSDASQNFLVVLPDQPIAIGDNWTDKIQVKVSVTKEIQRTIHLLRTYQLTAVKDGIAHISLATSIVDPVRTPSIRAQLIQREPSGKIQFDIERGLIVHREANVDKTVFEPFGPKSALHAVSRRVERLVMPPTTEVDASE